MVDSLIFEALSQICVLVSVGIGVLAVLIIRKRSELTKKRLIAVVFPCFFIYAILVWLVNMMYVQVTTVTSEDDIKKEMLFSTQYSYKDKDGKDCTVNLERGNRYILNNTDKRLMHYSVHYGNAGSFPLIKRYEPHTLQKTSMPIDYTFTEAPHSIITHRFTGSKMKFILDWEEDAVRNINKLYSGN